VDEHGKSMRAGILRRAVPVLAAHEAVLQQEEQYDSSGHLVDYPAGRVWLSVVGVGICSVC
jgi:hypothetical protein